MFVLAPLCLSNPADAGLCRESGERLDPAAWQRPAGLLLGELYWARRIADNYTVCCSQVHKAWPVSYYTIGEENLNLVAAWLSAFPGVFLVSPMVPAELGRGG